MDYHDLPAFMQKLAAMPSQSARALELTILTLSRTAEMQNMRWSQLLPRMEAWQQPKRSTMILLTKHHL